MNIARITLYVLSLAASIWIVGCGETPNPLKSWKWLGWIQAEQTTGRLAVVVDVKTTIYPDKAITDDYQNFIKTLPKEESYMITDITTTFYEDRTGQHAVNIEIPIDGKYRDYALIYDKSNKRTKLIKYSRGHYQD
jgi:plasmid replication initiation protein